MLLMVVGLVLFIGVHSVRILAPARRDAMVARLGEGAWKGLYSLIAAVGLVAIVWGYGLAREAPVVLWDPPVWTRHLALTLMVFAFPLLFAAYLPGRIRTAVKHPMLAAVKIWAFAHLLANGTLADVLLFASLLAWAVIDRISAKRRPNGGVTPREGRPLNDTLAVGGGLALYAAFVFGLHEWLFGVAPIG